MAITNKQMELDKAKWIKSEQIGKDACGTFDYCVKCDKELENPCDKAYAKFNKTVNAAKKEVAATSTAKKAVAKKPAVKKATAKKSK